MKWIFHTFLLVLVVLTMGILCFREPGFLFHGERSVPKVAKVLFVGDMMFDRTIRSVADEKGYDHIFSCIDPYISKFDLVVGNLEGPITFGTSTSQGSKPGQPGNTNFTFSSSLGDVLVRHNIKAVNIGNNHILDRGWGGLYTTEQVLGASGVTYFGAPDGSVATTTHAAGVSIGLVNFNQFLGQNDPAKTITAIKQLKSQGIFTIVYTHWGEEYVPETETMKTWAHSFIDAGADVVIGSHPHVIQAVETYKGKQIFYSLGNFIFDQYWESAVYTGLGVEMMLVDNVPTFKEHLFTLSHDGTTCP